MPLWFRAVRSGYWTTATCSKLDRFSRTARSVASEKCTRKSTALHTPCTTFPQAQKLCNQPKNSTKWSSIAIFWERKKVQCP